MYKMKNISTLVLIFALVIFIIVFFSLRVVKEGFGGSLNSVEKQAKEYQGKINNQLMQNINNSITSIQFSELLPSMNNQANSGLNSLINNASNGNDLHAIDYPSVQQYYGNLKRDIQSAIMNDLKTGKMSQILNNLTNVVNTKLNDSFNTTDIYVKNKGYSTQ